MIVAVDDNRDVIKTFYIDGLKGTGKTNINVSVIDGGMISVWKERRS